MSFTEKHEKLKRMAGPDFLSFLFGVFCLFLEAGSQKYGVPLPPSLQIWHTQQVLPFLQYTMVSHTLISSGILKEACGTLPLTICWGVVLYLIAQCPMQAVRTTMKLEGLILKTGLTSNINFRFRRFPVLPSVFSGLAFIGRHRMW